MPDPSRKIFEFGAFCFDEADRLLLLDGKVVPLTPKAAETLLALITHAGHVVDRDELLKTVWPGTFVEESSLTRNISQLRKALSEDEAHPFIETIPKRGYRFVAEVRQRAVQADAPEQEAAALARTDERPVSRATGRIPGLLFLAASVLIAVSIGLPRILSTFDQSSRLDETPFTTLPGGEYEPAFSPDGTQIAFVWNGPDEKRYGIYVKPVKGGDAVPLVSDSANEGSPAWSADSKYIAFCRYSPEGNSGVFVINVQDRSERKLTPIFRVGGVYDRKLDWSPSGALIAIADKSSPEEPFHVDLVDVGTGERHALTKASRESRRGYGAGLFAGRAKRRL